MILTKAIKPKKLQDDKLRLELLNEMRSVGKDVKKDFEKTTSTWKHKPKFELLISLMQPGPTILVGTNDEIYGYVNYGTKPHAIFAGIYTGKSDKKALAFPSAFTPKTTPGRLEASAGSSGGSTVLTPYVDHPGTKPRNFDKLIRDLWKKKFKDRMEEAMKRAAKASGHAI